MTGQPHVGDTSRQSDSYPSPLESGLTWRLTLLLGEESCGFLGTHFPSAAHEPQLLTPLTAPIRGFNAGSGSGFCSRYSFTQLPRVPSLICNSLATWAVGRSFGTTICTASALNWALDFRRGGVAIYMILSDNQQPAHIL